MNMEKPTFKKLCYMYIQQLTNFPFIEEDFDAITDYQFLCKVVHHLNEVIKNSNTQNDAIISLYNAFSELKDYVDNFFDNLDVQDEIDNKLDEMVEDGTFENIMSHYINDYVEYIFPKKMDTSGDCSIIKYKNKNIVIDTYSQTQWLEIKNFLDENDVDFIDYLIITHYHSDHAGNFNNLLNNGYINQNTIFFMPAETTQFGDANNEAIENYKTLFQNNNLTYRTPIEGETVVIENNLKMTFFNCDPTKLDNYYPHAPSSVNATSTVTLFEYKGNTALFMGDCTQMAYKRMYEEKFIKGKIDLFKIGHHGIDDDTYELFIRNITPTFAVQMAGLEGFSTNQYTLSNQMQLMYEMGTILYPTYLQDEYIKFTSNNNINNITGLSYQNGGIYRDFDIYVDSSINDTDYQNGTELHPFKDLPQVCSIIKNYTAKQINIHLADGEYCFASLSNKRYAHIINANSIISLIGNSSNNTAVKLTKGLKINNSNIIIQNLSIDCSISHGLEIEDSILSIRNCILSSEELTTNSGIFANTSILNVYNTSFSNMNVAISLRYGCHLITNNVTYDNISNYLMDNQSSNNIIEYQNHYGDNLDKYFDLHNYTNYTRPMLIYSDAGSDYTIHGGNFPILLNRVKAVELFYKASSGIHASTGKIFYPQNKNISLQVNNINNGNIFAIATLSFTTNSFTINDQKAVVISDEGNVSVTTGNIFKVIRVVAYLDDEINMSS